MIIPPVVSAATSVRLCASVTDNAALLIDPVVTVTVAVFAAACCHIQAFIPHAHVSSLFLALHVRTQAICPVLEMRCEQD